MTDFGRYEILGELARGACGIVYRARDRELDRPVALKTLRPPDAGPVARERFLREARLAARLEHPNIVRVFETGEHEGRPFYTMALIEGAPLRGPLPPAEACRIIRRLALAAAYAHARGIVHRDLKPANILIRDGEPVLTDFGVARGPDDPRMTEPGELLGTPAYMAPEQARGEAHDADGRADVYSLGVVLFELLAGRLPHDGDSFLELSSKILSEPAPELTGFDPALAALVRRCLEKDPDDRPDAAALARGLERWDSRRRPVWPLVLSGLLLLAAGSLWAMPAPASGEMLRVGEIWIDRDEAPARAGGYSYLDAVAGCLRQDKRLPSETEWEAAIAAGARDLDGHLAEWTSTPGRAEDTRVIRGGHWLLPPELRSASERAEAPVSKRLPIWGYRCASATPR